MPNQRASNKRVVGVYITDAEHAQLKWLADRAGMNKADYIRAVIRRMVAEAAAKNSSTNPKTKTENHKK